MTTTTYNRKFQIALFFTIATLFFISISAYSPFVTPYANELGLSPSAIGAALGATGMASLLTRFPVGIMSQLLKKKKLMMQIGLLIVFSWMLVILFPGFNTLYLAKAMGGITGATWVLYTAIFPSYFSEEDLPKSIGIIQLASSIGPLLAANFGGYLASLYGFEFTFVVAMIAAGTGIFLSLFLKEPQVAQRVEPKEVLQIAKNQLTSKNAWIIGLFATVAMMSVYAGNDYLVPVLVGNMGGEAFELTMVTNFFRIFGMIAAPVCGFVFYKKLGLVKTIAISGIITGIAAIASPYAPNFLVLYSLRAVIGFCFNTNITALMALAIMGVSDKEKPARMGLYQSIYAIGLMVGPMTSGRLAESLPLETNYLIFGSAIILAGLLAKPLLPKGLIAKSQEEQSLSYAK